MSTDLTLTAAEYDQMVAKGAFDELGRKIELVFGSIKSMNPAGPVHDDYIEFLTQWSVRNTDAEHIGVRIQSGLDLSDSDSRPEPDILWVKAGRYLDQHPQATDVLLLIEVSDSTIQFDRATKAELYARSRIPEYWIVDIASREILVHREPKNDRYGSVAAIGPPEKISPLCRAGALLDLETLFC